MNFIKPTNSFVRFLLVGVINTCVGLLIIFFLLNVVQLSYWVSTFTGNTFGACTSFWLNRSFTFKSSVPFQKGLPRFFSIILICYFGSYFLSEMLTVGLNLSTFADQNWAVLFGSALYTISNYLGQKYFVFNTVETA